MADIITKEYITKKNIESGFMNNSKVYADTIEILAKDDVFKSNGSCIEDKTKSIHIPKTGWNHQSKAWCELWNKAEGLQKQIKRQSQVKIENKKINIIHMPPEAQQFWDLMRIDITRQIMIGQDLTGFFATIIQDDGFDDPTKVQALYPYGAPMLPFDPRGGKVKKIYTQLGAQDTVEFDFWGIGWEQDLYNALFNKIFSVQKINEAIARGVIQRKNDRVISPILTFAFPTAKIVVSYTSGGSVEDNYYTTITNAIKKIGKLYDPQTEKRISTTAGLSIACDGTEVDNIAMAVSGRLQNGSEVRNLAPLTKISRIIPYDGDRIPYVPEPFETDGIPSKVAYLYVNGAPNWYLLKRDVTSQVWAGEAFTFSSDRNATYFVDSRYNEEFLGGADGSGGGGDPDDPEQQGFIVKINLPPDIAS